jgi:polysaccharide deacetylase family protein (PEP-CTERM system associated)
MLNAFTVDVEDYFQVTAFEKHIQRADWNSYPHRVVDNTKRMLDLLASVDVKGTFYILGWVANEYPALVRGIVDAGHEVASHSYWHRLVYELTPDQFRQDLRDSKRAIEDACGQVVDAYRAPSFSITQKSIWALDVLVEEGFTCDSSIFPVVHDRYGIPGAKTTIHKLETKSGSLWEFPPSVRHIGKVPVPISGGGYFRLFPTAFTADSVKRLNRQSTPFMFYIHPWEIDPGQMRMPFCSMATRFRHYVNLSRTHNKLERLLNAVEFGTVSDVLESFHSRGDRLEPVASR